MGAQVRHALALACNAPLDVFDIIISGASLGTISSTVLAQLEK
jgi:hypothetical protein